MDARPGQRGCLLTRHRQGPHYLRGPRGRAQLPSSAVLSKPAGSWHGVAAHMSHSSNRLGCFGSPGATNKALAHCSPALEVVVGGSSNGNHQHVGWVN